MLKKINYKISSIIKTPENNNICQFPYCLTILIIMHLYIVQLRELKRVPQYKKVMKAIAIIIKIVHLITT